MFFVVHFPVDGCHSITPPEKPPRSMSQTKSSGRKSKSSTIKRKLGKINGKNGEAKWYLESASSINTNNNNNNIDNSTISSARSTPITDRPSRKLGKMNSFDYHFNLLILPVSESSDELSKTLLLK